MTPISIVCLIGAVCVALPAVTQLVNLRLWKTLAQADPDALNPDAQGDLPPCDLPPVSVLVPARDEQSGISETLRCLQRSEGVSWELLVLDDHSSDQTASIVASIAAADDRVRLLSGARLPEGWNGKQFACWQLAQAARFDRLLFLDADVRVYPDTVSRLVAALAQRQPGNDHAPDLLSVFPQQITGSWAEQAIVPLIYYVLLGFLPVARSRRKRSPALAAGCGQMFITTRESYFRCDGHRSIAPSRHDGLQLPRSYRRAGLRSDIADGSDLAQVRMYRDFASVCHGVMKNADEGLARAALILPTTVFCLAPITLWITLGWMLWESQWSGAQWDASQWGVAAIGGAAALVGHAAVFRMSQRFRLPKMLPWLYPLCLVMFAALHWLALVKAYSGQRVSWRGRSDS